MKSIKETQNFIQANYAPLRDLVIINSPSQEELDACKVTKSGIITTVGNKKSEEPAEKQYEYTVLAVGPEVTDIKAGDKVLVKARAIPGMLIEDYEVGIIGKYEVAFIKKSK